MTVHLSVSKCSPSRLPYTAYATEQARHGINGIRKEHYSFYYQLITVKLKEFGGNLLFYFRKIPKTN